MDLREVLDRLVGAAAGALGGISGPSGPSATAPLNPSAPAAVSVVEDIKDLVARLGRTVTGVVDSVTQKVGTAAGKSAAQNAMPTILMIGAIVVLGGVALYVARR
jgi:hypothetical protein